MLCDIDTLSTLPPEIFADGCAEAVKTGILTGGELYSLLREDDPKAQISRIISLCIAYKGGVVERDEKEQGERKLLNLGHTAGHAIEKCSGYTVSHGQAVAIGTAMIARAADRLGWSAEPLAAPVEEMLGRFGLPVSTGFTPDELLEAALSDKKRSGKMTSIVVPEAIGRCVLKDADDGLLLDVFKAGMQH